MIRLKCAADCRVGASWLLVALMLPSGLAPACTTAVISGRATADGRPILWKNRDAPHKDNEVIVITDGRYRATAVINANKESSVWMGTAATISRRTSVSAAVFHGVRNDEDPRCTTMWVLMGEPIFSVAVPCWAAVEEVAAELNGDETSPLCTAVRELRQANYRKQDGDEYLQCAALPSILAETLPVEAAVIEITESRLRQWRTDGADPAEMTRIQQEASAKAMEVLERLVESSTEVQSRYRLR